MGVFIPYSALPNLKKYKYSSEDHSIVTKYVLKPFWLQFVKIFPLWMAPNLVTLLGFLFIVTDLIICLVLDPTLDQPSPSWAYILYGIGLFLYQTFDACDGTHARRTGQSGPLGELFDHCVDACNTSLCVIIFASSTGMGYGWQLLFTQLATLTNFYLSTWEEYYTGTLYLSACSGPVEGILVIIVIHFISAAYGSHIWTVPVWELIGRSTPEWLLTVSQFAPKCLQYYLTNFSLSYANMVVGGIGLSFNILSCPSNVRRHAKAGKVDMASALRGHVPFFAYYSTAFLWALLFPSVVEKYCIVFMCMIAATCAFSVGRIIVAHLTLQPFPMYNAPMFIPPVMIVLSYLLEKVWGFDEPTISGTLVSIGLGLSLGIYGMFITEIITEITTYLDIWCLSIKHKKTE